MELRKFKSFLVVAKELHFGKAASKLNVTQPALSHQIKQLESELGFDLFDKDKRTNNRKVELTEKGIYLMKEITRVIDLLDRTLKNAKISTEKNKQLKFGVPKLLLTSEILKIMDLLKSKFPDTEIKIIEFASPIMVQEALYKDDINIGVTIIPIVFKNIEYCNFKTDPIQVIMSKNHQLAKYKKIRIEQLRNDNWIELIDGLPLDILDKIELNCRDLGFSRDANVVQNVTNLTLLLGLVSSNLGVSLITSSLPNFLEGVVSKNLIFPDDKSLEFNKIFIFKKSLDENQTIKFKKLFL